MKRLRYPPGRWRQGLLLLLLGALLFAAAYGALAQQPPDAPNTPDALPHLANEKRRYYITNFNAPPADALDSCAAGYHMASLWEIFDPGKLEYAADLTPALKRPDQGSGPVTGWWGWVRTGGNPSTANVAGQANCNLWTSNDAGHFGTLAQLPNTWTGAGGPVSPWSAQVFFCAGVAPVWCASDTVYGVYIPLVVR